MRCVRYSFIAVLLLAVLTPLDGAADMAAKPKPKQRLTKWIPLFDAALLQARKEKKCILAYFTGSDWAPFSQKLEKDVLNTDLFREWAAANVILFEADYPKEKSISANIKTQNDRLKQKFSIIKVPTFVLMDSSGLPFARAGYDEAKLRDDEATDQPKAWLKYLDDTIKNRPPDEVLIKQKNFTACVAYGKKHFLSSVFLVNQGRLERTMSIKEELTHNQLFVRFINHNVAYTEFDWPYDADTSPEAASWRAFAASQNVAPSALQLIVMDMQTGKVRAKIASIDPAHAESMVQLVENSLRRLDYNGGWIDDYHTAQAVAQQQKRFIFLCFTAMDSSEFSKKIFEEIFDTEEFKDYAKKHLVTVRIDFPTATTQPTSLATQNKMLAEMYAIRGFPWCICLNPQGQKIADSKYMKGGPEVFLKELSTTIKLEEDRRALLLGEQQK
ncbi:MAG TPA: thioredoxin fold domain-containing protein [Tepidisphaeraceae bacterium]|jgi:thioredoxin-related protein|nr:thioredoxin fold domain-containing protein [Tepidisphaeraceae bacterium]